MRFQITDQKQISSALAELQTVLHQRARKQFATAWGLPSSQRFTLETYVLEGVDHDVYVGLRQRGDTLVHNFSLRPRGVEPKSYLASELQVAISLTSNERVAGLLGTTVTGEGIVIYRRPLFTSFRRKIKEQLAMAYFGDAVVTVQNGMFQKDVLPVFALHSPTVARDLETFMLRLHEFKEHFGHESTGGLAPAMDAEPALPVWREVGEFEGSKTLPARGTIIYEYKHGEICNRLAGVLEQWASSNYRVKCGQVDCALIQDDGLAQAIFEVKSSGDFSSQVYKAVGQLLFYRWSYGTDNAPLFLVVPGVERETLTTDAAFFSDHGITLVLEDAPGSFTLLDGTKLQTVLDRALG